MDTLSALMNSIKVQINNLCMAATNLAVLYGSKLGLMLVSMMVSMLILDLFLEIVPKTI